MAETPKRIHLKSANSNPIIEEGEATQVITPGHLCELGSDSDAGVNKHSVVGGSAEKIFALEDSLQGKTIAQTYAIGDRVNLVIAQPGDHVYAWLTAGEDVTRGTFLSSSGDGTLEPTRGTQKAIAKSLEVKDNTVSSAVAVRLRVVIL